MTPGIDRGIVADFLGPGHEALADAIVTLCEEASAEVAFATSLRSRTITVRTQASRIVPAGRLRRKPRRVLLRLSEVLSFNGDAGRTGVWVPTR